MHKKKVTPSHDWDTVIRFLLEWDLCLRRCNQQRDIRLCTPFNMALSFSCTFKAVLYRARPLDSVLQSLFSGWQLLLGQRKVFPNTCHLRSFKWDGTEVLHTKLLVYHQVASHDHSLKSLCLHRTTVGLCHGCLVGWRNVHGSTVHGVTSD